MIHILKKNQGWWWAVNKPGTIYKNNIYYFKKIKIRYTLFFYCVNLSFSLITQIYI